MLWMTVVWPLVSKDESCWG